MGRSGGGGAEAVIAAALLLLLGLQDQGRLTGPVPIRPIEDDEIAQMLGGERDFLLEVERGASRSPAVRKALQRRGMRFVCEGFEGERERLRMRYYPRYRRALAAAVRQGVDGGVVLDLLDQRGWRAGEADLQRRVEAGKREGAMDIRYAADDLIRVIVERDAGRLPNSFSDRLTPETLARIDRAPDSLPYYCSLSPKMRERMVSGYLKEGE